MSNFVELWLKAAGEEGIELTRDLVEEVFSTGVIPKDWEESIILSLYKGKGEALDRGNYRGLKLTDQADHDHRFHASSAQTSLGSYYTPMIY